MAAGISMVGLTYVIHLDRSETKTTDIPRADHGLLEMLAIYSRNKNCLESVVIIKAFHL